MGKRENEDEIGKAALSAGTRLGKYEIVSLIGAGSMGAVYEARHDEIGKRVAIKVLSPHLADIRSARERFLREAQLTTRVRHPHIVDVTDVGTDAGQTYLVMELLTGEDLAQRLERSGRLPVEEMADILLPVCDAIAAAHRNGITHRDLKPHNIFLAMRERRVHPKVLDFGISISTGSAPTNPPDPGMIPGAGTVIGTPYYLAPEQIVDNRAAGPASDQYALGVIVYECLTGERPFDGDSLGAVFQAIAVSAPRPPTEHRPDLPPRLEDIVCKAMRHDPTSRFASVAEFGQALLPFASSRSRLLWEESFGEAGAPGPIASPSRRRPPSSPAIAAEAKTPSPFVRTLPPEAPETSDAWFLPDEEETAEGTETAGALADQPTTASPNRWLVDARAGVQAFARRLASALENRRIRLAGAISLAVVIGGVALLATRGGSSARSRAATSPTVAEAAVPAPQPPAPTPEPTTPPAPAATAEATPPATPTPTPSPAPTTEPAPKPTPAATAEPAPPGEPAPTPTPALAAKAAPAPEPAPTAAAKPAPAAEPAPAAKPAPVAEPAPAAKPAPVAEPAPAVEPAAPIVLAKKADLPPRTLARRPEPSDRNREETPSKAGRHAPAVSAPASAAEPRGKRKVPILD